MPGIGLDICEISRFRETKRFCMDGEINGRVQKYLRGAVKMDRVCQ